MSNCYVGLGDSETLRPPNTSFLDLLGFVASTQPTILLHLSKSAASAGSALYKACMGIFLINLLIACTALRLRGH